MREARISGLVARKGGRTTIRVPGVRVAGDLVQRQFRPTAPDVLLDRRPDLPAHLGRLAVSRGRPRRLLKARSWGGRWPTTCAPSWSSTPWRWRSRAPTADPGLIHRSDQGS